MRKLLLSVAVVLVFAAPTFAAEFCVHGAVNYRIGYEPMQDAAAYKIHGYRMSPGLPTRPIVGTAFLTSTGAVVIAFQEVFDYGAAVWAHPVGTTVLRFNDVNLTGGTYDTTYNGNGISAAANFKGAVTSIPCSTVAVFPTPVEKDPNAK